MWTDDERRSVVDAFRPWLSAQQAAQAAQQGASGQAPPLTEGPDAVWAAFIERARSNVHWAVAMSPEGDAFRTRRAAARHALRRP